MHTGLIRNVHLNHFAAPGLASALVSPGIRGTSPPSSSPWLSNILHGKQIAPMRHANMCRSSVKRMVDDCFFHMFLLKQHK